MKKINGKTPLQWGELACDTLMDKFEAKDLPPVGRFHYHQGVFLMGMEQCFLQDKEEKYQNYIKEWVDSIITPDGTITKYDVTQLDDMQPGILLFSLYEKTKEERYKKALDTIVSHIKKWKTNSVGGFWHKDKYPNQMWLDGLFMGGPVMVQYGKVFQDTQCFDLITHQAKLMYENTVDEKSGLLYHGWDESKKIQWADPVTGKAPEFWGRSIGWIPVALLEILDYLPKEHKDTKTLISMLQNVIKSLIPFQDEKTGLWYQVIDKVEDERNWLETSCTCLFVSAIAKAVRMGYLHEIYLKYAWKGFEGIIKRLNMDENGKILIEGVCVGTGIGDYEFYLDRPTSTNDLHGAGAFIIMCAQMNLV